MPFFEKLVVAYFFGGHPVYYAVACACANIIALELGNTFCGCFIVRR